MMSMCGCYVCSGSVRPVVGPNRLIGFNVWQYVLHVALWCDVAICLRYLLLCTFSVEILG